MPNTLRIQAVLNRNYFRESPALEVYANLVKSPDWTDRKIITEALIALGEKLDSNWQAPDVPNEVTISHELVGMIHQLGSVVNMLANMDISELRQIKGFDENVYNSMKAEGLKRGAARMLSDDTTFDESEW